jgi:hypothetical protein
MKTESEIEFEPTASSPLIVATDAYLLSTLDSTRRGRVPRKRLTAIRTR